VKRTKVFCRKLTDYLENLQFLLPSIAGSGFAPFDPQPPLGKSDFLGLFIQKTKPTSLRNALESRLGNMAPQYFRSGRMQQEIHGQ